MTDEQKKDKGKERRGSPSEKGSQCAIDSLSYQVAF
jgi:hypothetical protein